MGNAIRLAIPMQSSVVRIEPNESRVTDRELCSAHIGVAPIAQKAGASRGEILIISRAESMAVARSTKGARSMKKLVLETTAPFQGLPELVAYDEGLFEKEGLAVEWVDREKDVEKKTEINVISPKGLDPFSSHGKLLEQGRADMYNACEWGNYCRVQDTKLGSRQVGRRGIVTYAALAVRPDSPVYTAQQLAGRTVGVPFYFGTHYLALHMLEGFLPRGEIKVCSAPNGSRHRYDAMMKGEIEATTLTEPYATLAEKNGCRLICEAFYHGTEVASDKVDAVTYGAFNRAVRAAVRRINADKRAYLHYFIDYHKAKDPEVGRLRPDDIRASRIVVCDPAPIPLDEMRRTYDWLRSWDMLEETASPLELVNTDVQTHAHVAAE
jgi:NitT/TauT family transport system substrate-binding protein